MRSCSIHAVLNVAPSAWVLPLKFGGGGYRAGGKAMFDSEGNLWVGDNFTVGWQGTDSLWQGNATKFNPNGKPLSPAITGFSGGGMEGGTFGAAVDAKDNAWFGTYGGKSIAVFDKNGKPLTPPEGITFGGRLGLMQGIIATPKHVWAAGFKANFRFPQWQSHQRSDHAAGRSGANLPSPLVGPFTALTSGTGSWSIWLRIDAIWRRTRHKPKFCTGGPGGSIDSQR